MVPKHATSIQDCSLWLRVRASTSTSRSTIAARPLRRPCSCGCSTRSGAVVARKDVMLQPGGAATLQITEPGLYRAHAQVLEPPSSSCERRAFLGTVEIFRAVTGNSRPPEDKPEPPVMRMSFARRRWTKLRWSSVDIQTIPAECDDAAPPGCDGGGHVCGQRQRRTAGRPVRELPGAVRAGSRELRVVLLLLSGHARSAAVGGRRPAVRRPDEEATGELLAAAGLRAHVSRSGPRSRADAVSNGGRRLSPPGACRG